MCGACYQERFGSSDGPPVTEPMRKLAARIRSFMDRHPTGSGLHIVTDDWNLSDDLIGWCRNNGLSDEEESIAADLLMLTEDERYAVMYATKAG